MATLTVYSSAGDGGLGRYPGETTYASAHDGTNATVNSGTDTQGTLGHDKEGDNDWRIGRIFLPFDTSSLPDDCTINSATLSVYTNDVRTIISDSINVVQTTQASGVSLANSDYQNIGTTTGSSAIAWSALVSGAYNNWVLDATGLSWINKTGYTKLGLRSTKDINNTAPTENSHGVYWNMSETIGTSQDPKLVIDYTDNTTTSTTTSTSTTSTSSSTTMSLTTSTSSSTSSSTTRSTSTSTTSTSSSTTMTSTSTTSTSSSTTSTSSSTTMPFSIAVDNV